MNTPPKNNNLPQDLFNLVSREIGNLKTRVDILDKQRQAREFEIHDLHNELQIKINETNLRVEYVAERVFATDKVVAKPTDFESTLLAILSSQSEVGIEISSDDSNYQWLYKGIVSEGYSTVSRALLAWIKYIATRHEELLIELEPCMDDVANWNDLLVAPRKKGEESDAD